VSEIIDLSHEIHDGMVTYPGLPAPSIRPHMTYDESHAVYADGYEFQIDRIDMIANTGTYLDSPAHRLRGGADLADLDLSRVADVPILVIDVYDAGVIGMDALDDADVAGKAVLFATGWDRHWGTSEYGTGHPYLTPQTADALVMGRAAVVGIDSLNVDGTADGTRPIHTALLEAGIPILEHLTNLDRVPASGARLFAVPPKIRGMGSFPVRAFCIVD